MAKSTRGWRKFDEIPWEDGTKHIIRCSTETGEFMVEIEDPDGGWQSLAKFQDKDLNTVKEQTVAWLKDNSTLSWEAIIVVKGGEKNLGRMFSSEDSLSLKYDRYFRAKRKDGSYLWKEYAKDKYKNSADKDDVTGMPGRPMREPPFHERVVLPYTAERWSALRMISLIIKQMNERINALIDQGKFDDMLLTIAQRGAALLLSGPKETAKAE
jgi:hypothetical protein